MTEEKAEVLGVDYVILQGRGGRESTNGASTKGDKFVHLSVDMGSTTLCKRRAESFMMTYADVRITCKECVKELVG